MNDEKILLLKKEILKMYSCDLPTRMYTLLRLKLSPILQLEKYVSKRGYILDLGCGTGIFANILYLGSQERKILGIDRMSNRIETANTISKDNPQLEFMVGDVNDISLDGFGIITLIDLLHHMPFPEQDDLLKKVYEKMSAGGVVLIKDLEKSPYWKYIFHYIQDTISYKGARLYFRSTEEMEELLTEIGFEVETVSLANGYPHPHVLYKCIKRNR